MYSIDSSGGAIVLPRYLCLPASRAGFTTPMVRDTANPPPHTPRKRIRQLSDTTHEKEKAKSVRRDLIWRLSITFYRGDGIIVLTVSVIYNDAPLIKIGNHPINSGCIDRISTYQHF